VNRFDDIWQHRARGSCCGRGAYPKNAAIASDPGGADVSSASGPTKHSSHRQRTPGSAGILPVPWICRARFYRHGAAMSLAPTCQARPRRRGRSRSPGTAGIVPALELTEHSSYRQRTLGSAGILPAPGPTRARPHRYGATDPPLDRISQVGPAGTRRLHRLALLLDNACVSTPGKLHHNALVHTLRLRVSAQDTALARGLHMHYSVYLRYLELAAMDHLAAAGISFDALLARHAAYFAARRIEVEYLAPALAGDDLDIRTWVEAAKGARLWRRSEIHHAATGRQLLTARTEWVWCDRSHRPRRLPAEILSQLLPDATC